jgi:hypothetical protein
MKSLCISMAGIAAVSCLAASPARAEVPPSTPDPATAHAAAEVPAADGRARSPWLFVPLVSSGPKLGTSAGALAGYVQRVDEGSQPSMLALKVSRSNTRSTVYALGGKLFWHQDRDRLFGAVVGGTIHNAYQDFGGTGGEVNTREDVRGFFLRYLHGWTPHWFIGAQASRSNYGIEGEDAVSSTVLDEFGIVGSTAVGIGLVALYDTRDNVGNASRGVMAQLDNFAFRDRFGGDDDYDAVNFELRVYRRTGADNVVALRASARWTRDAPPSRESTIEMRGYTRGQYLGRHATALEVEDRYMFRPRWGAKAFGGVTCLYGDGAHCGRDQLYPMLGAGVFFIVKPADNMLVSAEYAKGSGENHGFYLRFGQPF